MARDLVEFTRTARALQDVPLAHMVEAAALGVIEAQRELDKRNIEIVLAMGDPSNGLDLRGGRRRSLLELGLSPTFYQFTEATFTFIIDITVQESDEFSITATLGGGFGPALGASPSLAPGASTSPSPRPSLSPGPGASHLPSPQPSPSPGASPSPSSGASPSLPPGGGSSPSPHASPSPSPSPSPSLGASPSPAADWGDVDVVEDGTTEEEGDD